VKYKKVISRKKAGKQARTIIVSVPKEEEEMVDIGVRPKKRGRPRKAPGMDPPDPRKGSVPDPGKGVCADPVNGGAILGKGGPDPQGGNKERQLDPDKGRRDRMRRRQEVKEDDPFMASRCQHAQSK
jgi:hypothetical protein